MPVWIRATVFVYNYNQVMKCKRLKELRTDEHLTQDRMARLLKVSQKSYSRYETGQRDISTDKLILIAQFFNTSVDYILGITDVRSPYPPSEDNDYSDE